MLPEPTDDLALYIATLEIRDTALLAGYTRARWWAAFFLAAWLTTLAILAWCWYG